MIGSEQALSPVYFRMKVLSNVLNPLQLHLVLLTTLQLTWRPIRFDDFVFGADWLEEAHARLQEP